MHPGREGNLGAFDLVIVLLRCTAQSVRAVSSFYIILSRKMSGSVSDGLLDIYTQKLKL